MRQTARVVLAASRSDALALLVGLGAADYDRLGVFGAEALARYVAREVALRVERANAGGRRQVLMRSPTRNAFPLVPAAIAR